MERRTRFEVCCETCGRLGLERELDFRVLWRSLKYAFFKFLVRIVGR
jgi:hypothetical protein